MNKAKGVDVKVKGPVVRKPHRRKRRDADDEDSEEAPVERIDRLG